ncbi:hypothetical protein GcM1_235113 [Golovinomyces cichoracearum]|uniref:Uncharacterized protein n=1 Tax=Golovinomyces cichoracearum TaxID=62708 RepID=A0A420IL75_9PEZI|nr:hypothetical protein GcM1_235113 [Golovinomyces cichoracearum]
MSYYDNQQQWSTPSTQSWEQQSLPARSVSGSTVPREDLSAFATQLEEVDRAVDNLVKSGKMFSTAGRRESMPVVGGMPRAFSDQTYDPRLGTAPRHHSISDFGDARSFSASNLQNFYANQRHQPSRGTNEAEQVMQAKRRMAAQRERELRNYHQEQQYNRSVTAENTSFGGKNEHTLTSSNGMKDDERREMIARKQNALFSDGVSYPSDGIFDENGNKTHIPSGNGIQAHSTGSFDKFNGATSLGDNKTSHGESQYSTSQVSRQAISRANSISSPSSNPPSNFALFDSTTQKSSCTSSSSTGESPPNQCGKSNSSSVAPIGTRPIGQNLKRAATPLHSPLSYAFTANESVLVEKDKQKTTSNHVQNGQSEQDIGLGWVKGSVWSNKSNLGVQAPVWG